MQSELANTMAYILDDQQRIVEKDLLSFRLTDVMLFDALAAIAFVPVKSFDLRKVKHVVYYHHIPTLTRGTEGLRLRACAALRSMSVIPLLVALGTDRFYMMAAYPKSELDDLSIEQCRRIWAALEGVLPNKTRGMVCGFGPGITRQGCPRYHSMFGPRGNPQAKNLFSVIGYLQKQTGLLLHVTRG